MYGICYLTKLKELVGISPKAYKAIAYDGSEAILPKSQVHLTNKENEIWVSAWLLDKVALQHSCKMAKFDDNGRMLPNVTIEKHIPKRIEVIDNQIDELKR